MNACMHDAGTHDACMYVHVRMMHLQMQMKSGHNQNLQKHTKQSNIFHQVHFMIKIEMTGETHYHYKSYCQS